MLLDVYSGLEETVLLGCSYDFLSDLNLLLRRLVVSLAYF